MAIARLVTTHRDHAGGWIMNGRFIVESLRYDFLLLFGTDAPVLVHREMEKPGSGDKAECTRDHMASICRLGANPERERQGGIVPPSLRSWPLGRRSGRVATVPYPPPRSSFIVALADEAGNGITRVAHKGARLAARAAFLLSRAASSLRSRSAKMIRSRPASLSAGAI